MLTLRFAGGPVPVRGIVVGGVALLGFRVVKLGGPEVHKARGNVADAHDLSDVFLSWDSSIAPLLDVRRRMKAVMDLLDYDSEWAVACTVG